MLDLAMTKGYTWTRHGDMHWHRWAGIGAGALPLVCLHPLPHSGQFFRKIAPLLAIGRSVLAPNYPGYGNSNKLSVPPSIALYAEAMMDVLKTQSFGAFDLFGFQTGCLVAVEMSLQEPEDIRRMVLVDAPFFDAEKRAEFLQGNLAKDGFVAAFNYPCENRFSRVTHQSLVMATQSTLLEPSRQASKKIPGCHLKEYPEITAPALVNGATTIASSTLDFLGPV